MAESDGATASKLFVQYYAIVPRMAVMHGSVCWRQPQLQSATATTLIVQYCVLQASGALQPGGLITEGTAGSTGVSLAMVGEWTGAVQDDGVSAL
jgi:hypothetical protein